MELNLHPKIRLMILERRVCHMRNLTAILLLNVTRCPVGEMKLTKQARSLKLPVDIDTRKPLGWPSPPRPSPLQERLLVSDKHTVAFYCGVLLWGGILKAFHWYRFQYDYGVVFHRTCLLHVAAALYALGNPAMFRAADRHGLTLLYTAVIGLLVGQGIEMCLHVWLHPLLSMLGTD